VLAYVQAGVTALGTVGRADRDGGEPVERWPVALQWSVAVAQVIGAGLLIAGGVALTRGSDRARRDRHDREDQGGHPP